MKTYSVNPEQEPQSSGSVVYRFVLALIIFICLSYVTFASTPNVQSANEPSVEFTSLTLIKVGAKLEVEVDRTIIFLPVKRVHLRSK